MTALLSLLLPVYGSDDTVQVNDTTNIEVECLCETIDTPLYTIEKYKELIIAGEEPAFPWLDYQYNWDDEGRMNNMPRYAFIMADKFSSRYEDVFLRFESIYLNNKMRMDTIMWNCIFDYIQVAAANNYTFALKFLDGNYQYIKRILVDSVSRYDTIVTPIEPQDSVAYRVFCQDQFVNFYIPQDQQPNYEDNFSYALIMADKYHYPKAYADVYKYIVNIYRSNDMTMSPAMQKLALNFLRKGVALNDSTALAEMSNLQGEQGHIRQLPPTINPQDIQMPQ